MSGGRVDFTYEVEVYGSKKWIVLPYVVGVLADLRGSEAANDTPLAERKFLEVDRDRLQPLMAQFKPAVSVSFADATISRSEILSFESLDDFTPVVIARRLETLKPTLDARTRLRELRDTLITRSAVRQLGDRVTQLVSLLSPTPRAHVGLALQAATRRGVWTAGDLNAMLVTIDDWLGAQVGFILHQPAFQRVEAAWRTLAYMTDVVETSDTLKLRVLDVTKSELLDDYRSGRSALASQLEMEYYTLGGEPLAILVGDMSFGADPADVELVAALSSTAASCHCTFLAAAAPELLNCADFGELHARRRLTRLFTAPMYAQWRRFIESRPAESTALLLPRVVGRNLHVDAGDDEGFKFQEEAVSTSDQLWINPAFPLAARLAQVIGRDNWWWADGGQARTVDHIATFDCVTSHAGLVFCCPVETPLPDAIATQVELLGLVPLRHQEGTDTASIGALRSVSAGGRRSATGEIDEDLPVRLNVDLIVRYMRCSARDTEGRWRSVFDLADSLTDWLKRYVVSERPGASGPRPLTGGEVNVVSTHYGHAWLEMALSLSPGSGEIEEVVTSRFRIDVTGLAS